MKSCPKVIIIVLNWNGTKNTCECLKSLKLIDYPNFEIIVVDNASKEQLPDVTNLFPPVSLIENEENLGFGGGLNIGIRAAKSRNADYVFCLNNDIIVEKHVIREMINVGESNPLIGALSPIEYHYYDRNRINYAGGRVSLLRSQIDGHNKLDCGQFNKKRRTMLLSGPAMMFKTAALFEVGLFDTNYFFGPEDQDIAIRLSKKGYSIMFVPKAKVWHKGKGSTNGQITPLNVYFSVKNRISFAKKHGRPIELIFFALYFSIIEFPLSILKCVMSTTRSKCVNAALAGIIWHINSRLLPSDRQIVDLLYNGRKIV